jgi:hypothetical protein
MDESGDANESCDGLLFPPEQAVKCTLLEEISSDFLPLPLASLLTHETEAEAEPSAVRLT